MPHRTTPPFRADHVGSLLRPPEVLRAREDAAAGPDHRRGAAGGRGRRHRATSWRCRRTWACSPATDGEFRRTSWHMDFIYQLGGIHPGDETLQVEFRNEHGELSFETPALVVDERIALPRADLRRRLRGPRRR